MRDLVLVVYSLADELDTRLLSVGLAQTPNSIAQCPKVKRHVGRDLNITTDF